MAWATEEQSSHLLRWEILQEKRLGKRNQRSDFRHVLTPEAHQTSNWRRSWDTGVQNSGESPGLETQMWGSPPRSVLLCLATQLCLTLCDPMDCSPPRCSVHGIFQTRILDWVAILLPQGLFNTTSKYQHRNYFFQRSIAV